MISIRVKWLNGELIELEVPYASRVFQILPWLTSEPFYKVTLFHNENVLSHSFSFTQDTELCILISETPATAIIYHREGKNYYRSVREPFSEKEYTESIAKEFEQFYIDYMTYYAYFDELQRVRVRRLLGIAEAEDISHMWFLEVCQEFAKLPDEGEMRLLWRDFAARFDMSNTAQKLLFPRLPLDKKQLLTTSQWASYCVLK